MLMGCVVQQVFEGEGKGGLLSLLGTNKSRTLLTSFLSQGWNIIKKKD